MASKKGGKKGSKKTEKAVEEAPPPPEEKKEDPPEENPDEKQQENDPSQEAEPVKEPTPPPEYDEPTLAELIVEQWAKCHISTVKYNFSISANVEKVVEIRLLCMKLRVYIMPSNLHQFKEHKWHVMTPTFLWKF